MKVTPQHSSCDPERGVTTPLPPERENECARTRAKPVGFSPPRHLLGLASRLADLQAITAKARETLAQNMAAQDTFARHAATQDTFARHAAIQDTFARHAATQDTFARHAATQDTFARHAAAQDTFAWHVTTQDTFARHAAATAFSEYRQVLRTLEPPRTRETELVEWITRFGKSSYEAATKKELLSFIAELQVQARGGVEWTEEYVCKSSNLEARCAHHHSSEWGSGKSHRFKFLASAAIHRDLWKTYEDPSSISRREIQSILDRLLHGLSAAASPEEVYGRLCERLGRGLHHDVDVEMAAAAARLKTRRNPPARLRNVRTTLDLILCFAICTGNPPPSGVALDCVHSCNSRTDDTHGEGMKDETLCGRGDRARFSHRLQYSVLQAHRAAGAVDYASTGRSSRPRRRRGRNCLQQNSKMAENSRSVWHPC
jgi:hypothetical protein